MGEDRVERRLAAILAADVAGYSRLMGIDEEGTLAALKGHRRAAIDPKITEHRGRIVKTTGDGVLVEFASVVDAVRCAVDIQRLMAERNAAVPQEKRIEFRIGLNVGDIIIDDKDIYGDGVNIAARLEGLAVPGGICVSRAVRDQVRDKLDFSFEDMGERQVKNIPRPIRTHRILLTSATVDPIGVTGSVYAFGRSVPQKPSIAVLPFANMSGDAAQEYFSEGISEDIITNLSRNRAFFVISRSTSFTYTGPAVDVGKIGRELGVRYVIEGSVRKAGNRVRLTAQLIDAPSGNHIWADRYEGVLADIFDLQDRITESVVGAIAPSIRSAEIERSRRKRPESLDAYDFVLRAYPSVWSLERSANAEALSLLGQAIAIEPGYPLALALAAWCHAQQSVYNWAPEPEAARAKAMRLAQAAAAASGDDPTVLTMLGAAHTIVGNHAAGARFLERALTLDPNSAWAWNRSGWLKSYLNDPETAIEHFERALRLSPFDPMNFNAFLGIGGAHFVAGRYAETV